MFCMRGRNSSHLVHPSAIADSQSSCGKKGGTQRTRLSCAELCLLPISCCLQPAFLEAAGKLSGRPGNPGFRDSNLHSEKRVRKVWSQLTSAINTRTGEQTLTSTQGYPPTRFLSYLLSGASLIKFIKEIPARIQWMLNSLSSFMLYFHLMISSERSCSHYRLQITS